jgi:DNA polymerase III epsilon subunit-like protein
MIKINPIFYNENADKRNDKVSKSSFVPTALPQRNYMSAVPRPYLPVSNTQTTFRGLKFQNEVVKKVTGKKFQGLGLYTPNGKWLDFSKVGDEFLAQESIDITKATDKEVSAYDHANSLREATSTWVRRYNKHNMDKMLATYPTLNSEEAHIHFAENLEALWDTRKNKSLDIPITDEKGNLCLDCVVFDTETTGLNIFGDKHKKSSKPLDKIIQIGAIQIKGGKVVTESAYSQLINPEMPIPEKSSDIHGITDEMVKDKPPIEHLLKPFLNDYLNKKNGVIVAYNSKFDITILNNAIRKNNTFSSDNLKEKRSHKVLDPFILMQRIHPYLGVRKKLGEQYQFLFRKKMENAHDAFADVKGTVDVLKYSLYYLSENRKDKSVPLTLREVLIFQNGGKVENINIPFDTDDCNAMVNYNKSYLHVAVPVTNYFKGYKLTRPVLDSLREQIGDNNYDKLKKDKSIKRLYNLRNSSGLPINPEETKHLPKQGGVENAFYVMKKNFKKVLEFTNLEGHKDKTKEEVEDLILENSKQYIYEKSIPIWMKNPNPEDIKDGNDMPNLTIARKVMTESKAAEETK